MNHRLPFLALFSAAALLLPGIGRAAEKKTLHIYCWSEYVPQSVIDAFEEETGVKVAVENYASNEEMVAKLVAGGGRYDLIQPSEYTTEALVKAGLLLPLDHANIPNLKNIAPEFTGMAYDPAHKYSVPWMAGTVGIVVNAERVKTPVAGFADVFKPEHKGRIVVVDDAREIVSWAMAVQKIPTNEINAANLAKVKPMLSDWLPLVKIYDSDSPKTALLNGDADIGVVWSGEAALLLREHPGKFRWVTPSEGTHIFVDNLAIPKTARNKATAEKFIDFILRPEISKLISADFPYTNPNAAARAVLSKEELANPASFPTKEEFGRMEIFRDIGDAAADVDALVTDIRAR